MEKFSSEVPFYLGKVGVDNFLLIVVGLLFFVLYALKRQEARYARLNIYVSAGVFFSLYGFFYDIYRIKAFRPYLLWNFSFVPYRTAILLATLLPLYTALIDSILKIIRARYLKRKSERLEQKKP